MEHLDNIARDQWENILHYVVNSVGEVAKGGEGPKTTVKQLLQAGNLVAAGRHGITQAGFTFLLQETNAQVWTLLLLWIKNSAEVCINYTKIVLS